MSRLSQTVYRIHLARCARGDDRAHDSPGLVPPLLTLRQGSRERLNGVLTGMAIRFMLTLALLLAALLSGRLPKLVLALWVAIGYLVLLAVDTAGVIWLLKRAERAST